MNYERGKALLVVNSFPMKSQRTIHVNRSFIGIARENEGKNYDGRDTGREWGKTQAINNRTQDYKSGTERSDSMKRDNQIIKVEGQWGGREVDAVSYTDHSQYHQSSQAGLIDTPKLRPETKTDKAWNKNTRHEITETKRRNASIVWLGPDLTQVTQIRKIITIILIKDDYRYHISIILY